MRVLRVLAVLLCALLLLPSTASAKDAGTGGVTAAYYYSGGAAARDYTPSDVPAGLLTHIDYAFARIDPADGTLVLPNPERDRENLAGLTALRGDNPELKILIAAGGWDGSIYFSDVASTAGRREVFAQSCLELILEYGLDGIDINWEYPVSGGAEGIIHRPEDRENFTLLLRVLREKLDRQGRLDGKEYCLTATGAASEGFLKKIEPSAVAAVTDYIFLMAYDYSGPWAERTGFNAPLDRVKKSARAYLDGGIPAEKLVLGMPLYGHRYQDASPANNGLNSVFSSASSVTYDAVVREYLTDGAYTLRRHSSAASPYLFGRNTFVSYDDPESIAAKASLARELGLAGIGFWELSQDSGGVLVQSARAAFTGTGFRDAAPGSWYAAAVERVSREGWMDGTAPQTFSPGVSVTRGMFAAILHRMEGEPAAGACPFRDVPADHYCAAAAAWAAENGIVTGYGDGTFRPGDSITREQLAAMLYRYAEYTGRDTGAAASLDRFQDAAQVSPYARNALSWAVAVGLLDGRGQSLLVPGGTASRAEAAVILTRFAERAV